MLATKTLKTMLTTCLTAEKIGFSMALNPGTISAYHDGAQYIFPEGKKGKYVRRAFMRGWNNGYQALYRVKKEIAAGEIVFVKYQGEYEDILSGKKILDWGLISPR